MKSAQQEKNISQVILKELEKSSIDIRNCIGQAYDDAAAMTSEKVGIAAFIKKWLRWPIITIAPVTA